MSKVKKGNTMKVVENKIIGSIPIFQSNYFDDLDDLGEKQKKLSAYYKNNPTNHHKKICVLKEINEDSSATSTTTECTSSSYGEYGYDHDEGKSCSESTVSQLTTTTLSTYFSNAHDRRSNNNYEHRLCQIRAYELLGDTFYDEKSISTATYNTSHTEEMKESLSIAMEGFSMSSSIQTGISNFMFDQQITLSKEVLDDEMLMHITSDFMEKRQCQLEVRQSFYSSDNGKELNDFLKTKLKTLSKSFKGNRCDDEVLQDLFHKLNIPEEISESDDAFNFLSSEKRDASMKAVAHASIKMGVLMEKAGQFEEAKNRYVTGLKQLEVEYEVPLLDKACTCRRLASVYAALGDYENAMVTYKQALLTFEQSEHNLLGEGEIWKEYAHALCDMGLLYHQFDKNEQTILLFEKEFDILLTYGNENEKLEADIYHRMGIVNMDLELYAEAILCYLKELDILRKIGDDEHALAAKLGLGDCYYFARMNVEGINILQDVVNQTMDDKKIALLNKLSILFERNNESDQALQLCMEAFALCNSNDNVDIESVIATLNNLGNINSRLNNFEKALECYDHALKLHEVQGEECIDNGAISDILYNIGILYIKNGSMSEANECFKKLLLYLAPIDIKNIQAREKNIKATRALHILGFISFQSGEYMTAIDYYNDSLDLKSILHGKGSAETIGVQCNLGTAYVTMGQYQEANSAFTNSLLAIERSGSMFLIKAKVLNNLGDLSMASKSFDNALMYYLRALVIKTNILQDENYEDAIITRHKVALALGQQRRYKEAIPFLLDVKEWQRSKLDEYDPYLAKITLDVANAYLSAGQTTEAELHCLDAMKMLTLSEVGKNDLCRRYSQKIFKMILAMKN